MIVDYREKKKTNFMKLEPISEAGKQAIEVCKKEKLFPQSYDFPRLTKTDFLKLCEYIASGCSPIEACRQTNTSIDAFFLFKHQHRDEQDIMEAFDEAFKSKGGVFIGRCEEVIDGLLQGKINSRTAEVALNGLFKLASIADKKYSDSPSIQVDARSVTVNQLDTDRMLELNKLLTGK